MDQQWPLFVSTSQSTNCLLFLTSDRLLLLKLSLKPSDKVVTVSHDLHDLLLESGDLVLEDSEKPVSMHGGLRAGLTDPVLIGARTGRRETVLKLPNTSRQGRDFGRLINNDLLSAVTRTSEKVSDNCVAGK